MTGTAKTEEKEFQEIYDLSVIEIPTNVAVEHGKTATTTSSRRRRSSTRPSSTTSESVTSWASRSS